MESDSFSSRGSPRSRSCCVALSQGDGLGHGDGFRDGDSRVDFFSGGRLDFELFDALHPGLGKLNAALT